MLAHSQPCPGEGRERERERKGERERERERRARRNGKRMNRGTLAGGQGSGGERATPGI